MYAGPGSSPILAAAAAWDGLAAELGTTSAGYTSVITELAGSPWLGPASQSMAAAAAPYISWLSSAATLAEEAGNQARAAAAAYETAFAMTVPPPVVVANRALLSALVATNFFGQNTPAIAATEAQYAEMWAQDAVAMYGYAGSSAAATQLIPFAEPTKTTDQAGLAAQSAAVSHALATPAANTAVPALASATPGLALTPDTLTPTSIVTWINQLVQQFLARLSTVGLNPNDWNITAQFGALTTSMRTSLDRTYETSYFDLGAGAASPLSIVQQLAHRARGRHRRRRRILVRDAAVRRPTPRQPRQHRRPYHRRGVGELGLVHQDRRAVGARELGRCARRGRGIHHPGNAGDGRRLRHRPARWRERNAARDARRRWRWSTRHRRLAAARIRIQAQCPRPLTLGRIARTCLSAMAGATPIAAGFTRCAQRHEAGYSKVGQTSQGIAQLPPGSFAATGFYSG